MRKLPFLIAGVVVLAAVVGVKAFSGKRVVPVPQQHTGAFQLVGGSTVAFVARDDGCLRVVLADGRVGRVCPESQGAKAYRGGSFFSGKGPESIQVRFELDEITLDWGDTPSRRATRVPPWASWASAKAGGSAPSRRPRSMSMRSSWPSASPSALSKKR